jgi:predicted NBD/HSP70 family sugar kinase
MKNAPRKSHQDKHEIEVLVRERGPISRVGIYEQTKLRRSTISLLTRELLAEGHLIEAGRFDNPIGRKQVLLQINPNFGFLAGVEFDDKQMTAGLMDLQPMVLSTFTEATVLEHGQQGLIDQILAAIRRTIQSSGRPVSELIGIGIADPGLVNTRSGVTASCSTIDFWSDVPLQAVIEQEFKVPTLVESKTRAKTIAERMLGGGEKQPNMIYVEYGTGIGSGVVVDGRLLYGQDCGAGEIGHTNIVRGGPTCKCGSNGCLEAVAGAKAIEANARKALSEGASSRVLAMAQGDPAQITSGMVFEAAAAGDKLCSNILSEISEDLAIAIGNLVNLFNPSVIVLDRRLQLMGDEFLTQLARNIRSHALSASAQSLLVHFAHLDRDAGLLGVGLGVLEKHFAHAPAQKANAAVAETAGDSVLRPKRARRVPAKTR